MEPAPQDLKDLARDWLEAGHARDGARLAALSRAADADAIFTFASAPDSNLTLDALVGHLTEVIPCYVIGSEPEGFVEGDLAWLVDTPRVEIPGEATISLRVTTVLQRQDGEWRVVHGHLSEGVPHLVEAEDSSSRDNQTLHAELLARMQELMFGTFGDAEAGLQAEIEHEDGIFTYPDGKRLTQAEHLAVTATAGTVLEHDLTYFEVQPIGESAARVYLDHTLRTTFTEFPFSDPELRTRMETGILFAGHFTLINSDRGWRVISMDAHEVADGYVPREKRSVPNIVTFP